MIGAYTLPSNLFCDFFTISLQFSASTANRLKHLQKSRNIFHLFTIVQLTKLSAEEATYKWEVIGTSINTSMALINHSCDPNTFRFNMDKTSIIISSRHIRAGEEITTAYNGVQFFSSSLAKREHHLLKHYMFQCECPACEGKWPEQENLEDELIRVPNFEQVGCSVVLLVSWLRARSKVNLSNMQERAYVVHHGDKGKICDEINSAR